MHIHFQAPNIAHFRSRAIAGRDTRMWALGLKVTRVAGEEGKLMVHGRGKLIIPHSPQLFFITL